VETNAGDGHTHTHTHELAHLVAFSLELGQEGIEQAQLAGVRHQLGHVGLLRAPIP